MTRSFAGLPTPSPRGAAARALPSRAHCLRVLATLLLWLLGGLRASQLAAQEAVTVSGHVSAGNMPLQGANVGIPSLGVGGTTDGDGRYSFIVPSSRVRGQDATLIARHVRYVTQSVHVRLAGGALVRDFELSPIAARSRTPLASNPIVASDVNRAPIVSAVSGQVVDSSAFADAPGPLDLPSALAGRVAGLVATPASSIGGSSPIAIRGWRSLNGSNEPLFVVDGTPIDNSTLTTTGQRFGFGGFDYGSAVQDLNLGDIAIVQVLSGPFAAALYGGRAANGVILISTKNGRGLNGFDVSANQQVTFESPVRRPSFQNAYGQGLAGKFAFFNGEGGGVNDAVAENWGPALQGQPIAQASLVEAMRADVRPWVAQPNNVSGYFDNGRALTTNIAAQGSNDFGSFRLSANNRDYTGVTPGSSITRRGFVASTSVQPTTALTANASLQFVVDEGAHRPGSGFDESNTASTFARLGRQVDVQALRNRLLDIQDNPISWNYAGHNNPYFEPLLNDNRDDRSRWFGGLGGSYAISPSVSASAQIGGDSYDAGRSFSVAPGWMGGYPTFIGREDLTQGGREHQKLSVSERNAEAALHLRPGGPSSRISFTAGASWRSNSLTSMDTVVIDTSTTIANAPKVITPNRFAADANTHGVFASVQLRVEDYADVALAARNEWTSVYAPGHDSQLYPSLVASMDLKRTVGSLRDSPTVSGARLRAGVSRAGNDLTGFLLQNIYTGNQTVDNVALSAPLKVGTSGTLQPETTDALELGGNVQLYGGRLGLDLAVYHENTSNLIVAVASQSSAVPTNAASVWNKGVEVTINVSPIAGSRGRWDIAANYAHNSSSVGSLVGGAQRLAVGPSRWGVGLEARKGQPLAAIVGDTFLRDNSGRLILNAGRPLPDTVRGPQVLGSSAPAWTGGLTNTIRLGWFEVSALLSVRMGGQIFSATNMWGATSGSFDETAFRPDTGLLIAGIDAVTGATNTQHVTTEDYYHALRAIPARWVYDASVVKLRDLSVSTTLPLRPIPGFREQSLRTSLVARNLFMWAKAPNIDPETAVSTFGFQGLELGQLPTTRSVGIQLTITP